MVVELAEHGHLGLAHSGYDCAGLRRPQASFSGGCFPSITGVCRDILNSVGLGSKARVAEVLDRGADRTVSTINNVNSPSLVMSAPRSSKAYDACAHDNKIGFIPHSVLVRLCFLG